MKRKIAAIFAADIAGYSKLVAEDEEETLRRLASYRAVMDDFIARAGGRIFNTAGDAVLAEFSSAVEAVRCAIDIQESLRTRNMAYPASRQMCFRIGITVGDVVERDGDLLGDGVNIAARLEGIAPVGGICISRTVHEQVFNKLSVQFADIGEQQVKNIPTPVHAYHISMRPDDAHAEARAKVPVKPPAKTNSLTVPIAIAAACVVLLIAVGLVYKFAVSAKLAAGDEPDGAQPAAPQTAQRPVLERRTAERISECVGQSACAARGRNAGAGHDPLHHRPRPRRGARRIYDGRRSQGAGDLDRSDRAELRASRRRGGEGGGARYVPEARRCAATAVSANASFMPSATRSLTPARHPPMPPVPWVAHDSSIERPLVAGEIPLMRDAGKTNVERNYLPGRSSKALALGPLGGFISCSISSRKMKRCAARSRSAAAMPACPA